MCVCVCVYKPLKKVLQLNVDISLCIIILNIGVVRKPTIPLYNDTPFAMIMDSRNVQDKYDVIKREISTLKIELWNFFEGFIYMKEVARGGGGGGALAYIVIRGCVALKTPFFSSKNHTFDEPQITVLYTLFVF